MSRSHWSISSWIIQWHIPIWFVSHTFGSRQCVRVVFLRFFVYFFASGPPSDRSFPAILGRLDLFGIGQGCLQNVRLMRPSSSCIASMRWMIDDKTFVLRIFHVELRDRLLSLSRSSRSAWCQIFSYSFDAFLPYDSGKLHKYNIQFLLPNRIDNKSIVLVNLFRTIRSTLRYPFRETSSSNLRWKDCRRCFASDLLVHLLGEDDFRSDLLNRALVHVRVLLLRNEAVPGFGSLMFPCLAVRVSSLPTWPNSSLSFWTCSIFCWSSSARLFNTAGVPVLANRLGWFGCSLLLVAAFESQSFRQLDLSVIVGAGRGDFVLVHRISSVFLDTNHTLNTYWWEGVMDNDRIRPCLKESELCWARPISTQQTASWLIFPILFVCSTPGLC